ncbi:hypothetical protein CC78DRAFT_579635 [Lojkania enalia]|uniref:Uncharacterized protein n=1 Tax=Lojkania enalia TaxID=147567 RepID=A0A9P4N4U4_9PLEO|nr:hypothetical protein CC78DRAFT_579635 [Didymosphaeria enalia]
MAKPRNQKPAPSMKRKPVDEAGAPASKRPDSFQSVYDGRESYSGSTGHAQDDISKPQPPSSSHEERGKRAVGLSNKPAKPTTTEPRTAVNTVGTSSPLLGIRTSTPSSYGIIPNATPGSSHVSDPISLPANVIQSAERPWPTPTPPNNGKCPIDWSDEEFDTVKQLYREIYELRAPWTMNPRSYEKIGKILSAKYGDRPCAETQRKRFGKVNRVVFETKGIWFKTSDQGIKDLVGSQDKAGGKGVKKNSTKSKTKWNRAIHHEGEFFTFFIMEDDEDESLYETREVPIELARDISTMVTKSIDEDIEYGIGLAVSEEIADAYISCFYPNRRSTLPRMIHRLVQYSGVRVWEDNPITWTPSKSIQLYCLALDMGSPDICDMILDHWRELFKNEIELRFDYETGRRAFHDVPVEAALHILDFEPDNMNTLWAWTKNDDPARKLWLEMLAAKGNKAIEKLNEDYDEYDRSFLQGLNTKLKEFGANLRTLRKKLLGVRESILEVPSKEDLAISQAPFGKFRVYHELCGMSQDEFCSNYHSHGQENPCYIKKADTLDDDDPFEQPPENPPAHYVKMTINDVQNCIVINHTGLPGRLFKSLIHEYPHWDWGKIRAVVNFPERVPGSMNLRAKWDPNPCYFLEKDKDSLGRFPSHPGYKKRGWAQSAESIFPTLPKIGDEDDEADQGKESGKQIWSGESDEEGNGEGDEDMSDLKEEDAGDRQISQQYQVQLPQESLKWTEVFEDRLDAKWIGLHKFGL